MTKDKFGEGKIREDNQRVATLLALSLIPLSGFATDIYIPSLPYMGSSLNVSSNQVQLTLSLFLISYGIAQLFVGSILDSFGRFNLGLSALLVFTVSCIAIASSNSIYLIYIMRIVQGIVIAIIIVAKRAYFIDVFSGDRLNYYLSIFTIIWSVGPILAPFLGGYLETVFGWRSNFYFLAIYSGVMVILEFLFSGETIRNKIKFRFSQIAGIYSKMIKTGSFTLGLITLGLSYCIVMVFNLTGPYILEHHFLQSPVVAGYCSLISGLAWMTGGFAGKLTLKQPFYKKLGINLCLQVFFIFTRFIFFPLELNLSTLMSFVFIIHATAGYTNNIYFTHSLSQFPKNAGIAGGLSGGVNYITVSVLSYGIVYFIPARNEVNLFYSYLILISLLVLVMSVIFRMNRKVIFPLSTS